MFVSLSSFSFDDLKFSRDFFRKFAIGFFLNYILFGLILIGLVSFFYSYDNDIFKGFLIIIAAPPGVVIIPFTLLYNGNIKLSVVAVLTSSLLVFVLLPLFLFIFIDDFINYNYLFDILLITLIFPGFFSFIFRKTRLNQFFQKNRNKFIDWSFFLIVYIVIGLNKDIFFNKFELFIIPSIILIVMMFIFGTIFEFVFKKYFGKENAISYILLLLVKNNPFSAVVSMQLIGEIAAIPSVSLSFVLLIYLIYFSAKFKK